MAKFRVEIERLFENGLGARNPFRVSLATMSLDTKSRYLVRSWEFEADDEAEVRKLFKEAQDQRLPDVVGFKLRSIKRLDAALSTGEGR